MSCSLCALPADRLLFDSESAAVVLHDDWAVLGHAMVVAKRHVENVSDLDESERRAFFDTYARAERVLLEATGAERAVIMKLGLQVPHLHLHIYPIGRDVDRAHLFRIIDGGVREALTEVEKGRFVEELRGRFR